ncbi:MAG: NADH:ubiquinone oxidoreductase subunit NDUFA12 [Cucumibacter sp.]
MKQLFSELFIWWHGQTLATRLSTLLFGKFVGSDEAGNRYYKQRRGPKRWVLYNGVAEPSHIPPEWHGWMHHRVDSPPTEEAYTPHDWEMPHEPNMTGTALAYRPPGSILNEGRREKVSGDYDAWSPE